MQNQGAAWTPRNWGSACAILAASAVTLTGVAIELEPETILLRSTVSFVVVGLLVTWTARWCRSVTQPEREE
jgi:hypothetical protein